MPGDDIDRINNGRLVDINYQQTSSATPTLGGPEEHRKSGLRQEQTNTLSSASAPSSPVQTLTGTSSLPCTDSDWNLLPTAICSVPSFESFHSRLGRSLHNLKLVPTSP